ncbi:MAG: hypothetical protein V1773_12835 [bacterium]
MLLNEYADLAVKVLGKNTPYYKYKNIIKEIFAKTIESEEKAITRLVVIDSFYSTNMSKRNWGIDEVANAINNFSKNDTELSQMALDFIKDPDGETEIFKILNNVYGYRKDGEQFGKASSLISKYFYFITSFQFPIYDRLVKISYGKLQKRFPEYNLVDLEKQCNVQFFSSIKNLNYLSSINDYNKLDNLLWLYGKVTTGSFSLIFSSEIYLELTKYIKNSDSEKEIDNKLRNSIKDNLYNTEMTELLGVDFINFCKFCFT